MGYRLTREHARQGRFALDAEVARRESAYGVDAPEASVKLRLKLSW